MRSHGHVSFQETRWSQVLRLGQEDPAAYRSAVESLARDSWRPVYAFLRRSGLAPDRAEDATQAFFLHLLEDRPFRRFTQRAGSFRGYLKKAIRTFAIDLRRRERARRRSPRGRLLSLSDPERDLGGFTTAGAEDPDLEFDRQWARQVFRLARTRMQEGYAAEGREVAFEVFRRHVLGGENGSTVPHRELAGEFGLSASQVNNHVSRGKAAFERYLRAVVRDSLSDPERLDEEMRILLEILTPG